MLEFIEETHKYYLNGFEIPSVSEIMKPLTEEIYGGIDEDILMKAAERGTWVHLQTENIDNNVEVEHIEKWQGYVKAYEKFKQEFKPSIIYMEQKLHNDRFAGTLDRIYTFQIMGGKNIMCDIKTTSILHINLLRVQLALYDILFRDSINKQLKIKIDEYRALQLKKNGSYKFVKVEPNYVLANKLIENYYKN